MSREELGAQAGLSYKQVRAIETGQVRRPREVTVTGIADALRVDLVELFPERVRP